MPFSNWWRKWHGPGQSRSSMSTWRILQNIVAGTAVSEDGPGNISNTPLRLYGSCRCECRVYIAAASLHYMNGDCREHGRPESVQVGKKDLRLQTQTQLISPEPAPVVPHLNACEKLLAVME
jgi:hypothetical protein